MAMKKLPKIMSYKGIRISTVHSRGLTARENKLSDNAFRRFAKLRKIPQKRKTVAQRNDFDNLKWSLFGQ